MSLSSTTLRMSCTYLGILPCAFSTLLHGVADDGLIAVADGGDDAVMLAREAADVAPAAAVHADDGDAQFIAAFLLDGLFFGRKGLAQQGGLGQRRAAMTESLRNSRRFRKNMKRVSLWQRARQWEGGRKISFVECKRQAGQRSTNSLRNSFVSAIRRQP